MTLAAPVGDFLPRFVELSMQLTGDRDVAVAVAASAVAQLPGSDRPADEETERALLTAVVRDRRTRRVVRTGTPLDRLGPSQRASVVLAFGAGWDPATIADARRTSVRRIRRDVTAALAELPEEEWRRLLSRPRWSVPLPADLPRLVRAEVAARRQRRRRAALAGASVTTALVGVVVAGHRVSTAPGPMPPTAHVSGLLPWAPRGPLVRAGDVTGAAVRAWRAGRQPPSRAVFVLYAGPVDGARLVVLQAVDDAGGGRVATVVLSGATGPARPVSVSVVSLADPAAPVVVVPVAVPRTGGAVAFRLLLAPGVRRLSVRDPAGATPEDRPPFDAVTATGPLSSEVRTFSPIGTAVRLTEPDGSSYAGLIDGGVATPRQIRLRAEAPPRRWQGLPRTLDVPTLRDDLVWWSQQCAEPAPHVSVVWVGGAPAFPQPVRVELVRCTALGLRGVFLAGAADGSLLLSAHAAAADAYATEFPAPPAFGLGSLLVVGSADVDEIHVGDRVIHGRVALVPLRDAGPARVYDVAGHRLRVR